MNGGEVMSDEPEVLPRTKGRSSARKPNDRLTAGNKAGAGAEAPKRSPIDESFGAVLPLLHPLSVEEMTAIASEEHAQETIRDAEGI
jgi:hypothetical protein